MTPEPAGAEPPFGLTKAFSHAGPTVRRIVLGTYLRRLREGKALPVERAADEIRASPSKISRIELGRVGIKQRDLADLLTLYGVTDAAERTAMATFAAEAKQPGWWHRYGEVLPSWFETYIGLEGAASAIRTYQAQYVPGLLQTEDYARALIGRGHPDAPEDEIKARLSMRAARQRHLAEPLTFWAVVDEAALRRLVGGGGVMRAQIEHLLEVTNRPNVTVQILPFSAGAHAASGPFALLRFDEPALPDVVYIEHLDSAVYIDKPEETNRYMRIMDRLGMQAATPAASRELLERALTEI